MPIIDYILGFIIALLVMIIIYKEGKEKEAIHNSEFLATEISELNVLIQQKNEEIKKLKEKIDEDEENIEFL